MKRSRRALHIVGARDNNLKNLSLDIPHDSLVVLTGLSGSGKSSLAFDTVYAEGQRRYIETFSPYTRQFFDKVKKPNVDLVEHVRPAIAIQQRTRVTGSRSTVGSMTNVNDYLKVLWSAIATPVCPTCGIELERWTASELAKHLERVLDDRDLGTILICAPVPLSRHGSAIEEAQRLTTFGYSRLFDEERGEIVLVEDFIVTPRTALSRLIVVLDRVRPNAIRQKSLADAIDQAFTIGSGSCLVISTNRSERRWATVLQGDGPSLDRACGFETWHFSSTSRCPRGIGSLERPRPALFSFNHPLGACTECRGFGKILEIDPRRCVPDERRSITGHAVQCWAGPSAKGQYRRLLKFCESRDISVTLPWRDIPPAQRDLIFHHTSRDYRGVMPWFKKMERKAYKMHVRVFLSRYRSQVDCPECRGTRLRRDALAYLVQGRSLPEIWSMPIGELVPWLENVRDERAARDSLPRQVAEVFHAILTRLKYLLELGLPYLNLDRQTRTLSGGETQRVNLAGALGSELISTQFVLDEPSVGLHARDTERLIQSVRALEQRGNSVLMVEHDPECIGHADQIIELGPRAGREGGAIVFQGDTHQWGGITPIAPEGEPCLASAPSALTITNARARNLKGFTLAIPLNRFVALTGVSGSGKSTVVNEVIMRAYERYRLGEAVAGTSDIVSGFESFSQVLLVDQAPLAKSPRANVATYSGIWEIVRKLLADTEDAKLRGLTKSSFSFNVEGGRCTACNGAGFIREDMQFLSDVYVPCGSCLGARFIAPVLEVRYKGYNAAELLNLSIDDAAVLFHGEETVRNAAETLSLLGLGHLTLGHPLSELSGGEAQRLKLVPFIAESSSGPSLLIFDEPTTGLHLHDVARLVSLMRLLRDRGHSVLCVEHNLFLIRESDWIIDLGPEGGDGGGELLLSGTLTTFLEKKACERSATARYLSRPPSPPRTRPRSATPNGASPRSHPSDVLVIEGAREHNLKNVSVNVPLGTMVAITGVSGSGKSTIAKDIIYAEGQRRYLDCLSPYARQFIKELSRPDIDGIYNVQPTLCVYQHTFQPSRLSTVATMSEIYNFLRLLFAKVAVQHCPDHPDQVIAPMTVEDVVREIRALPARPLRVLAPVVKGKKGFHSTVFERALEMEYFEVRVDGVFANPSRYSKGLDRNTPHTIEFIVARFHPRQVDDEMIRDAVTQAFNLASGTLIVHQDDRDIVFSAERTCPICRAGFFRPDPEDLSFNSVRGRCDECDGHGTLDDGALCPTCGGTRIGPLGRNLRLAGMNIHEFCESTPAKLLMLLRDLSLSPTHRLLAEPIIVELVSRAETLQQFGLDYISLNRACQTLSGGELQRLRLATAIGSPLSGVMYIFDEPSVGLHPQDNERVLDRIASLRERGNSVLMIEHDVHSIRRCDEIIDIGPGAGRNGGTVCFQGSLSTFIRDGTSLTAEALRSPPDYDDVVRSAGNERNPGAVLKVKEGTCNNIKNLNCDIPLGQLIVVAGVSGAGKSSFVHGVLLETLSSGKKESSTRRTVWKSNRGVISAPHDIERVLVVDQQPIGINSRSTPASYLGIWDEIRKLFANTIEAKSRGWSASFFSYNTGKGRCPECKGLGEITLEMNFLPDARIICETCGGKRFTEESMAVRYLDLTVSEVLSLTFDEARIRFANHTRIHRALHCACDLGLGYLTLGQSSSTLSGGESQRLKLVTELSGAPKTHTLYVLDEPTTGLHRHDVKRLLTTLRELSRRGHSVVVIEHDVDMILGADQVVEFGPGPGERGGRIIFQGHPSGLRNQSTPWGEALRNESDPRRNNRLVSNSVST